MSMKSEEDMLDYLFVGSTHSYILIFTDTGRVHWLKAYEVPDVGSAGKGKPIISLIDIQKGEKISDMISVQSFDEGGYVVMASRKGYIKKTELRAFSNPRVGGIIACNVAEGDELIAVGQTDGKNDILLSSRAGKAIRFSEGDVRGMGRTARGVRGITLVKSDRLVGMDIVHDDSLSILSVTAKGYGKRTPFTKYRKQKRGGQGVINIRTAGRNGPVVSTFAVEDDSEVIIISEKGKILRLQVGRIRQTVSRGTQGVKLIDLGEEDKLAAVTLVPKEDE